MIKIIGSHYFIGFYESIFNSSDDFLYEEKELEDELSSESNLSNISVEYEYEDFNKYKIDVAQKFMEIYVDKLIETLPDEIVEDNDFKFEIIEDSVWVSSPKYYNYETDKCYCEVDTNNETLQMIKEYVLDLKGVKEYLINHFTSYDGFISFISNDLDYWKSLSVEEYKDNMVIALLDMMLKLDDDEVFDDIHFQVADDISKYDYVVCYVEYDGCRYLLSDFEDKFL